MLQDSQTQQGLAPNVMSSELWARLPLELIREILVMLAMSSELQARQLRLVSSDVNVLVLPLIYQHIVIAKPEDIIRLTATLLPKRKHYIPALKSRLHIIPRALSTYQVESCVLVINDRKPSIETALASIAPVFQGISKLAITAQNLQAHGYWLRQHSIRPHTIILPHFGSPSLVNFYDPIFQNVTHLYTSITQGHRFSSVSDLPALTHLAVSTRLLLPEPTIRNVAASLRLILAQCKWLQMLVLIIDFGHPFGPDWTQPFWQSSLEGCFSDDRFILLPDYRNPRLEWYDIVNERSYSTISNPSTLETCSTIHTTHQSIWNRALSWKKWMKSASMAPYPGASVLEGSDFLLTTKRRLEEMEEAGFFTAYRGPDWEIDLVQRDDYHHPPASDPDLAEQEGFQSAFG